jgi:hypothetical protein
MVIKLSFAFYLLLLFNIHITNYLSLLNIYWQLLFVTYIYTSQALISESILIRAGSRPLIESSRVYISLCRSIIEHIFVFTNGSFNNRFEHESSLNCSRVAQLVYTHNSRNWCWNGESLTIQSLPLA